MHDTVRRILRFIEDPASDRFEDVALDVFAFQFGRIAPYRRFCEGRGATPGTVRDWRGIPPLPVAAFKEAVLCAGEPRHRFLTSGTTRGSEKRGVHAMPSLDLYRASWPGPFRSALLPDRDRITTYSLIPRLTEAPESSLAFMADGILDRFGTPRSRSFLGVSGLDANGLANALAEAAEHAEPVLLLATSFAAKAFLDQLVAPVKLTQGSRILETGGTKGRAHTASRERLHTRYEALLGVIPSHVVGEYGMTELCSQLYEGPVGASERLYHGPPWLRTRVLDPETLAPLPDGRPGLLAHCDLANAWSVASLVTEDLGIAQGDGIRLLGRAEGAPPRGCSIASEELLSS